MITRKNAFAATVLPWIARAFVLMGFLTACAEQAPRVEYFHTRSIVDEFLIPVAGEGAGLSTEGE